LESGLLPLVLNTAPTVEPHFASGTPTTSASMTSGCALMASSTSSGKTFSPPVLMHLLPRPMKVMRPSASMVAKSPGSTQRRAVAGGDEALVGLRLVLVVAEGQATAARQAPDHAAAGHDGFSRSSFSTVTFSSM
jgi:hypothetical protein